MDKSIGDPSRPNIQDLQRKCAATDPAADGMQVALLPHGECFMSPTITLLNRVRSEFIEMPGLRLRLDQAQRLWNLDRTACEFVLTSLVEAKFLRRDQGETYGRA
jgi:hypothetical protein